MNGQYNIDRGWYLLMLIEKVSSRSKRGGIVGAFHNTNVVVDY